MTRIFGRFRFHEELLEQHQQELGDCIGDSDGDFDGDSECPIILEQTWNN